MAGAAKEGGNLRLGAASRSDLTDELLELPQIGPGVFAVQAEEGQCAPQGDSLVSIDERVVLAYVEEVRCRLLEQPGVAELPSNPARGYHGADSRRSMLRIALKAASESV